MKRKQSYVQGVGGSGRKLRHSAGRSRTGSAGGGGGGSGAEGLGRRMAMDGEWGEDGLGDQDWGSASDGDEDEAAAVLVTEAQFSQVVAKGE